MISQADSTGPLFAEMVETALRRLGDPVSDHASFYLVSLLVDAPEADGPLCLRLYGPQEGVGALVFKDVGDQALFCSGFFGDRLRARGLSDRYYAGLGSEAYSRFALRVGRPASETFFELSRKFSTLQRTLFEVRRIYDSLGDRTPYHL